MYLPKFQSTCPRGARQQGADKTRIGIVFQSTCPRGARHAEDRGSYRVFEFQSTCPRGARRPVSTNSRPKGVFQSTCPRGARLCRYVLQPVCHYFNPRAHEGHDIWIKDHNVSPKISIHVPTRGTTCSCFWSGNTISFQSTCPRGARRRILLEYGQYFISIHVPTRGTTQAICNKVKMWYFNPRAHEGHDAHKLSYIVTPIDFNPRAHEGHDARFEFVYMFHLFQSTCPRGARLAVPPETVLPLIFQSTCPRGARHCR